MAHNPFNLPVVLLICKYNYSGVSINAKGYQHGRRLVQLSQTFRLTLPKDTNTADVLSKASTRIR